MRPCHASAADSVLHTGEKIDFFHFKPPSLVFICHVPQGDITGAEVETEWVSTAGCPAQRTGSTSPPALVVVSAVRLPLAVSSRWPPQARMGHLCGCRVAPDHVPVSHLVRQAGSRLQEEAWQAADGPAGKFPVWVECRLAMPGVSREEGQEGQVPRVGEKRGI